MNIDVKKNDSGHWFYSFAIEKGTAPRTLLAGVTEESATVPIASVSQPVENVNTQSQGADDGTRYALDEMSEEQHNSFGWASEADAMSGSELDDLHAKIQARKTLRTFKQSARGEAIIEVNNDPYATLGVNNVFVFVKGTKITLPSREWCVSRLRQRWKWRS